MQNVKASLLKFGSVRCVQPSFHNIHLSSVIMLKNYYDILEIPRNATAKQIKSAYYDKAKVYHPDVNKNPAHTKKFQDISEAYEVLVDIKKKKAYDVTLFQSQSNSSRPDLRSNNYKSPEGPKKENYPINMSHLHYVYRTLNQSSEEPKYDMSPNNHNYPNSDYNKYMYKRAWDAEDRKWVYIKRNASSTHHYQSTMSKRSQVLQLCMLVMGLGAVLFGAGYKYFLKDIADQSLRPRVRNKAGMYIFDEDELIGRKRL